MYQLAFLSALMGPLAAFEDLDSGKAIVAEDTKERYVQLREGREGDVFSGGSRVQSRHGFRDLREVHGDLKFICSEIYGRKNPRIVVESKKKTPYQVVYRWGDHEALKIIAKPLRLVVAREKRAIPVITIRVSADGHRLERFEPVVVRLSLRNYRLERLQKTKHPKLEEICCDSEGRWSLDGVTADELARFLEIRYCQPVVNLTRLEGRWSIRLSGDAGKVWPSATERIPLDDLGLELQWEKKNIPVTVIKDSTNP